MTSVRDPQSFDHLPARYDRFAELVETEVRTWLLFHLPPPGAGRAGSRAVDLGCGTGRPLTCRRRWWRTPAGTGTTRPCGGRSATCMR